MVSQNSNQDRFDSRSDPSGAIHPRATAHVARQLSLLRGRAVAALAMLVFAPALLGACGSDRSVAAAKTPAHGDFAGQIDIGDGRELYLRCAGLGSPTVILESGIHDSSDPWNESAVQSSPAVLSGVSRFTRVCEYDRPGTIRYSEPPTLTARSTPVSKRRTLPNMVRDLHALLTAAGVPGPYVLVGHSFGGMIVRLFAQTYASECAGLVLVDAFGTNIKPLFGDEWPAYEAILNHPGTELDNEPGFETIDIDGAIQAIEEGAALPMIPLAVISKTEPFATAPVVPESIRARLEEVWPEVQNLLVELGPNTPHFFATGSDHYVQIRDPALTIRAIELVFNRGRPER